LVALKMIRAGAYAGDRERARFQAEAEAAARLRHPNIVQVYEVGQHDGRPFLALEFVEGGSLASRLKHTPQPPHQAAQLVETLARAVEFAHQQGVVHRDLKPANILLAGVRSQESGVRGEKVAKVALTLDFCLLTPKITDFGLAKLIGDDAGQTGSATIV